MSAAGTAFPALSYGWPLLESFAAGSPVCAGGPPTAPTDLIREELCAGNFFAMMLAGRYRNASGVHDFGSACEGDSSYSDSVFAD